MGVERIAHRVGIELAGEIDMRDLTQRMHAGIGAPGALHVHLLAAERRDRRGERPLHRRTVCLYLPADERSAVILDQEFVARHLA